MTVSLSETTPRALLNEERWSRPFGRRHQRLVLGAVFGQIRARPAHHLQHLLRIPDDQFQEPLPCLWVTPVHLSLAFQTGSAHVPRTVQLFGHLQQLAFDQLSQVAQRSPPSASMCWLPRNSRRCRRPRRAPPWSVTSIPRCPSCCWHARGRKHEQNVCSSTLEEEPHGWGPGRLCRRHPQGGWASGLVPRC